MGKSSLLKKFALIFGTIAFVSSCMSFGRLFNSNIDWIKKGETTKRDVVLVMGEPQEVGSSGGVPTWTYYFYRYKVIGSDSRKEIKFYWGEDGTVNHFSFSTSFQDDIKKAAKDSGA